MPLGHLPAWGRSGVSRATELEAFRASSGRVCLACGFCDHSCSHEPWHPNCVFPLLLWLQVVVSVEVGNKTLWRRSGEWEKKGTQARGCRERLEKALGSNQFRKRTLGLQGKGEWGTEFSLPKSGGDQTLRPSFLGGGQERQG